MPGNACCFEFSKSHKPYDLCDTKLVKWIGRGSRHPGHAKRSEMVVGARIHETGDRTTARSPTLFRWISNQFYSHAFMPELQQFREPSFGVTAAEPATRGALVHHHVVRGLRTTFVFLADWHDPH